MMTLTTFTDWLFGSCDTPKIEAPRDGHLLTYKVSPAVDTYGEGL